MIIRKSPFAQMNRLKYELGSVKERVMRTELEAVTGLSMLRSSDNPGLIAEVDGLKAGIADQDRFLSNVNYAESLHNVADSALGSTMSLMNRIRELAVQSSNESYTAAQRAEISAQVAQLRDQLITEANTEVAGRFVFAGEAYDAPAYDATGVYQGGAAQPQSLIGDNHLLETGWAGSGVFDASFQAINDLETALNANDPDAIAALLPDIDTAQQAILNTQSSIGGGQVVLDEAKVATDNLRVLFEQRMTAAIGADPAETYVELAELRTTYESALQVTGGSLGQKLFDYIR